MSTPSQLLEQSVSFSAKYGSGSKAQKQIEISQLATGEDFKASTSFETATKIFKEV
jgi:hypothetical protein